MKTFWGANAWIFIHTIAYNYPKNPTEEDKNYYKIFFTNLKNILPCNECKTHYSKLITKFPIDNYLSSQKDLFKYTYLLHKNINNRLKKPNETFKNVFNFYKNSDKLCKKC